MTPTSNRVVGQTRDAGFQVGMRRTLPVPPSKVWPLLTSPKGRSIWLGDLPRFRWAKGATFTLADGTTGEVRVYERNSHLRLTWQPPGWERPSTIQVRAIPSGDWTVVAFHQERMPNARTRAQRRMVFAAALEELQKRLG
jgi:uncharacterized protein YndB with AHSA1/START domain